MYSHVSAILSPRRPPLLQERPEILVAVAHQALTEANPSTAF